MDVKAADGFRWHNIEQMNRTRDYYDYAANGILSKCLPKFIFGANPILVSFIQLVDMRLIMLFQYIDKLKHYKDIKKLY